MPDDGQQPDELFLYDAFISYRHVARDRKWAEWLIDALERYRIPKSLQDEKGLPPRLKKIFRDEDEVPASADLNDQIKDALKASRFLIVVCSPYTPRSQWVAREIEIFTELGRRDRTLALLTEGEPGDSFPAAMLEHDYQIVSADGSVQSIKEPREPLAADVRPRPRTSMRMVKRLAVLRLVACIIGVNFDDLRQRDRQRTLRRLLLQGALAAAWVAVFGTLGVWGWSRVDPLIEKSYRHIVWRSGRPEGLGPISVVERGRRETSYVVASRGATVVEVRRQSGSGFPQEDEEGVARWAIHDSATVEAFDRSDRPVLKRGMSANGVLNIEYFDVLRTGSNRFELLASRLIPGVAHCQRLREPIAGEPSNDDYQRQERLTFNASGFVVERRYLHQADLARNKDGSVGERFARSAEGLVTRCARIGDEGSEITTANGVRALTLNYDRDFNVMGGTFVDGAGLPIKGPNGFASFARRYDERGNQVLTGFEDVGNKPTLSDEGYAQEHVSLDAVGNRIELAYLGVDDYPILNVHGYATVYGAYDSRSNLIAEAFLGLDGKPTISNEGCASRRVIYGSWGNARIIACFGVDGVPLPRPQ
jgi:hypothetical protein